MLSQYQVWKLAQGHTQNTPGLYEKFQHDVRNCGYVCMVCGCRFTGKRNHLACPECVSRMISRKLRRPELKYHHYVYCLYNEGELVYIGVSKNPQDRLQGHLTNKIFDGMVLVRGFSGRHRAEEFETMAIEYHQPPLNKLVKPKDRPISSQWLSVIKDLASE